MPPSDLKWTPGTTLLTCSADLWTDSWLSYMSPFGSIAAVDLGKSSSNMVQPLSYTGPDMFFMSRAFVFSLWGVRRPHIVCLENAGIPSKLWDTSVDIYWSLFYQSLKTLKTGWRMWMYTMHLLMGHGSKQLYRWNWSTVLKTISLILSLFVPPSHPVEIIAFNPSSAKWAIYPLILPSKNFTNHE